MGYIKQKQLRLQVTLIYHKHLDDTWMEAAKNLRAALGTVPHARGRSVDVIGRSRKQKIALDRDYVVEQMLAGDRTFTYQQVQCICSLCHPLWGRAVTSPADMLSWRRNLDFLASSFACLIEACVDCMLGQSSSPAISLGLWGSCSSNCQCDLISLQELELRNSKCANIAVFLAQIEGAFSQPNGGMCGNMLQWARAVTSGSTGDLLELYCGNGNFTIALAEKFRSPI